MSDPYLDDSQLGGASALGSRAINSFLSFGNVLGAGATSAPAGNLIPGHGSNTFARFAMHAASHGQLHGGVPGAHADRLQGTMQAPGANGGGADDLMFNPNKRPRSALEGGVDMGFPGGNVLQQMQAARAAGPGMVPNPTAAAMGLGPNGLPNLGLLGQPNAQLLQQPGLMGMQGGAPFLTGNLLQQGADANQDWKRMRKPGARLEGLGPAHGVVAPGAGGLAALGAGHPSTAATALAAANAARGHMQPLATNANVNMQAALMQALLQQPGVPGMQNPAAAMQRNPLLMQQQALNMQMQGQWGGRGNLPRGNGGFIMKYDDEEEEADDDQGPDLLEKVTEISTKLRSMLGIADGGDRYAAVTEEQQRAGTTNVLVTREQVAAACTPLVAGTLKSYQLIGINFLMVLSRSGTVGGAILADEMGLGKTAQTICFLGVLTHMAIKAAADARAAEAAQAQAAAAAGHQPVPPEDKMVKPHLIVCPASLIENWQRELRQWCPNLRVVTYYGKQRSLVRHSLMAWRKARIVALHGAEPEGEERDVDSDEEGLEEWDKEDGEDGDDGEGLAPVKRIVNPLDDEVTDIIGYQLPDPAGDQPPFNVMLTTYSMFERDTTDARIDRSFLTKFEWSHLVADEAHALKNQNSIRSKKLTKVARMCEHRIMLTGTPLQNDVSELLNLLRFLMPTLFTDEDQEPKKPKDEKGQAELAERMRIVLSPFILRRLKSEVASQLVTKARVLVEIDMLPEQQDLYKSTVANMRAEALAAANAAAAAANAAGRTGRGARRANASAATAPAEPAAPTVGVITQDLIIKLGSQRVSNMFTQLRKVALHPLLVRNKYTDDKVTRMAKIAASKQLFGGQCTEDRVYKELASYSDHKLHCFAAAHPYVLGEFMLEERCVLGSGKVAQLLQMLLELKAKGSRVLIFSQWTQVLDILEWVLHTQQMTFVRLDGTTQVEERLAIVDQFNNPDNGVFAFLLSTRAGGQGLNLTGADTVILHDVDFNPQVDRQAEDRCHRLGQTRPVTVYRLVTKGTVDENILQIAERKLQLDAAILEGVTVGTEGGDEGGEGGEVKRGRGRPRTKPLGSKPGGDSDSKHMGAILAALLAGS